MIGIFDSGIGGLTTVKAIMDRLPAYDICYFGDTARTPYGSKSHDTVIRYARELTAFLVEKGARIIIMACNTASSVATKAIRSAYAELPLFEVITPAVDRAIAETRSGRIGVIGTRATIKSGIYERMILEAAPDSTVISQPCPLLVPLVEEGWLTKPETRMIVKKYLHPVKTRQVDTLILGCTHYPLLKPIIQKKAGARVKIIDSSIAVTDSVVAYLGAHPEVDARLAKNGRRKFYVSDVTDQFAITARAILRREVSLTTVDPSCL
ncbi:MAG: glutamate racemase [Deltaproteobacteria bacterium]|nr:MAG: glutamate racemase [Deltaproteobacteria bacterium]